MADPAAAAEHDGASTTAAGRPGPELVERLDAVPGAGAAAAQIILAEIGLDMNRFPSPEHPVSRAKLCPRTIQVRHEEHHRPSRPGQSPAQGRPGRSSQRRDPAPTPSSAHATAGSSNAGDHAEALVAVARSIPVIAWHPINDPAARYQDLGADRHQRRLNSARKSCDPVRRPQALGHQVTLAPTA
ncbi:transposase [Kitasatospora sp. NPDC051914]|uniref:transposase n=1 Tax=Kitasatospora sp. NPDC051914 TaxID=3154945 RepID=UPI00342B1EFC